jgi:hypothetical protein
MSNTETQPGKAPTYIAWVARETKNGSFWTRIGAAWPHKNGKPGFNIQIDAVPLDGKISLFLPSEKKD